MQLLSTFYKGFSFLLCVIDIFSKCVWVLSLKDKKGETIVNALENILDNLIKLHFKGNPYKIWVDHGSEFYKNSLKHLLNEMTQKCIQHIVKENLLFLKDY